MELQLLVSWGWGLFVAFVLLCTCRRERNGVDKYLTEWPGTLRHVQRYLSNPGGLV